MSLIVVEKPALRTIMKLAISKQLVDEFEQELAIFSKNNRHDKLNFDNFANKLINELKKINKPKNIDIVPSNSNDNTIKIVN